MAAVPFYAADDDPLSALDDPGTRADSPFAVAFEAALVGMLVLGPDRRILAANRSLCRLLGWSADELRGRSLDDIAAHDQTHYRRADGSTVATRVCDSEIRGRDGALRYVVVQVEDLDALGRTQRELTTTRSFFRHVLASIPELVVIGDLSGRILFASRSNEASLGYSEDDLVGRPFLELVTPDQQAHALEFLARVQDGGPVAIPELAVLRKDGGVALVEGTAALGRDDAGRPSFLIAVYRDVTERRANEERAMQAQKLEAVGELTAGIAHDFNNLLTVIGGFVQLALADAPEDAAELRDELHEIAGAATSASDLVRQLLLFSRSGSPASAQVDASAVVGHVVKLVSRVVGESIEVVGEPGADGASFRGDGPAIEQCLLNLAVNARDAMPDGGTLAIRAARSTRDGVPHVGLLVEDTGTGMDAATRERIFEPFFTTKGPGEGTGLGLAAVHGIVERLDGAIEVDSVPGRGTRVELWFPEVSAS